MQALFTVTFLKRTEYEKRRRKSNFTVKKPDEQKEPQKGIRGMAATIVTQGCVCVCARAQSCPALGDMMGGSLSGSSVLGILQARITGAGCHFLLQGIFLTQELNPHLLHLLHSQANSLPLYQLRSPNIAWTLSNNNESILMY